ncbi:hypothetical protein C922_05359 [Plasmodium inui San Antonio 1]|uniref:Uncharacterized protein n=1 Tax=Plasmodium inui San Antonio 1 TaxID=1237626 RepID=W6ZTM3_9APIC|nr:hypothetical protein C922_05359 [Plasmodium inui San Antonio 1]EUD64257.1 hypothetical protein C922_05359 [Plasmodium inui San Antonio 1]
MHEQQVRNKKPTTEPKLPVKAEVEPKFLVRATEPGYLGRQQVMLWRLAKELEIHQGSPPCLRSYEGENPKEQRTNRRLYFVPSKSNRHWGLEGEKGGIPEKASRGAKGEKGDQEDKESTEHEPLLILSIGMTRADATELTAKIGAHRASSRILKDKGSLPTTAAQATSGKESKGTTKKEAEQPRTNRYGGADNDPPNLVKMASGVLSLRDQSWSHRYAATNPGGCDPDSNMYCLGEYGGQQYVARGFLGSMPTAMMRLTNEMNWEDFIEGRDGLRGYIMGPTENSQSWKGLLCCVVSRALAISVIKAKSKGKTAQIWEKGQWQSILRNATTKDWSKSATGKSMLMTVGCIIAAMMVRPSHDKEISGRLRKSCETVWQEVALELEAPGSQGTSGELTTLNDFLEKLREVRGTNQERYDGFGFLISLYYGLMSCCRYGRNYELTRLIRKEGWSLEKMGSCKMDGQELNCEGQLKQVEGDALNIWNRGSPILISQVQRMEPKKLKLTTGSEKGDEADAAEVEQIKRKNEEKGAKLMEQHKNTKTNTAIVAATGTRTSLTSADTQNPAPRSLGAVTSPQTSQTPLRSDVGVARDQNLTGEVAVSPPRSAVTRETTPNLDRAESLIPSGLYLNPDEAKGPRQTSSAHSSRSRGTRKQEQDRPPPTGVADPTGGGSRTIGIIGAAVSGLLGLASLYGFYRIFKSTKGGTGRRGYRGEKFLGRIGYGVAKANAQATD